LMSKHFVLISAQNDPYVPIGCGRELAKNLGVKLIELREGGHLNAEYGCTEFPFLWKKIEKIL